jgi:hypothetical protein
MRTVVLFLCVSVACLTVQPGMSEGVLHDFFPCDCSPHRVIGGVPYNTPCYRWTCRPESSPNCVYFWRWKSCDRDIFGIDVSNTSWTYETLRDLVSDVIVAWSWDDRLPTFEVRDAFDEDVYYRPKSVLKFKHNSDWINDPNLNDDWQGQTDWIVDACGSTGAIRHGEILIRVGDPLRPWSLDCSDPNENCFGSSPPKDDLPAVVTHEMGHVLGMADLWVDSDDEKGGLDVGCNGQTMARAEPWLGSTNRRDLEQCDILGIQCLYNQPLPCNDANGLLCSDDNPLAAVLHFSATQEQGFVKTRWVVDHEFLTDKYIVEKKPTWADGYTLVAEIPAGTPGPYEYQDVGAMGGWYRLSEEETSGRRIIVAIDSVATPFTVVPNPPITIDPDSLYDVQILQYDGEPPAVLPIDTEWLCVTPWPEQAQPLANFWILRGHVAAVADLNSIPGGASGLKTFLQDQYSNGYLRYVLIGGDANDYEWRYNHPELWAGLDQHTIPPQPEYDIIPLSYYIPDPFDPNLENAWEHTMSWFTPYTGGDWGYVDFDSDSLPDISVGRVPARSPAEMTLFVQKTIGAATMPSCGGSLDEAVLFQYARDVQGNSGALVLEQADSLINRFPSTMIVWEEVTTSSNPFTYPFREAKVKDAFNDGPSLLAFMGTASWMYNWAYWLDKTNGFSWDELTENNRFPFVLGMSCDIADVDRTEEPEFGRPLLESGLFELDRGPWGGFGPARAGWQPGHFLIGQHLLTEIYANGATSLGDAATKAIQAVVASNPQYKMLALSYMFLGDPLVPISNMRTLANTRYDDSITVCPAGDGEELEIDVVLNSRCDIDLEDPNTSVVAIKNPLTSPSIRIWDGITVSDPNGDSLYAQSYEPSTRTATLRASTISGCGTLVFDIYANGLLVAKDVTVNIRSFDQDPSILGTVDDYDDAAFRDQFFDVDPSLCGDFNWNGDVDGPDNTARSPHYLQAHHVQRTLYTPNGGANPRYIPSEAVGVSWRLGGGPNSAVTIHLYRNSSPLTKIELAQNTADDGFETCYIPGEQTAGTDYRIEVVHHVVNPFWHEGNPDFGRDSSDESFEIYDPGCPYVQSRAASGWRSENSVLRRSADGTFTSDAYRLREQPEERDGHYGLRIFENSGDYTTLDEVELVVLDVNSAAKPLRVGDRYVLGIWEPAVRAVTANGNEVTHLVDGSSGDYFTGLPGDTLYVELPQLGAATAGLGSASAEAVMQGGGGSGGSGGGKQIEFAPDGPPDLATDETIAFDTQILERTGILLQVPDGRGGWMTAQHYYPREHFDDFVIDGHVSGPMRLVFIGKHKINYLGRVRYVLDRLTPMLLPLTSAKHSRLGSNLREVADSDQQKTVIAPGDTLTLEFEAKPVPEGMTRHWFVVTNGVYSSVTPQGAEEPTPVAQSWEFALGGARPNPTTGSVSISYTLARDGDVSIRVYNVAGRLVRTLVNSHQKPGPYDIVWNATDNGGRRVPNGVYFYRMVAGDWSSQRKVVFLGR